MVYELHAPEEVSIEAKADDVLARLRERAESTRALGLTAQADFIDRELRHGEKKPRELDPLTSDELNVWKRWLPTCYRSDQFFDENDRAMRKMSSYMFDSVPLPVLKLWTRTKEQNLFDYYEIWTPEKQKTDPILLGVLGNNRYLLARWGESDANFLNFEDIARTLWARRSESSQLVDMETVYFKVFMLWLVPNLALAFLILQACEMVGLGVTSEGLIMSMVLPCAFSLGATWYQMKGGGGERAFIKRLFAVSPESEFCYRDTEHLRSICRLYNKTPQKR